MRLLFRLPRLGRPVAKAGRPARTPLADKTCPLVARLGGVDVAP